MGRMLLPNRELKKILLFLSFLAIWLGTPPWLRRQAQSALTQFQAPIWYAMDRLDRTKDYWLLRSQPKDVLIRQIVELSRHLSYRELAESAAAGSPEESEAEKIMDWHSFDGFQEVFAQVIRRDYRAWWQELVLWKGQRQGIRPHMAVLDGKGLVGRTSEVFGNHCTVELLTSPKFRIVANFEGDPRPVLFQGLRQDGFAQPRGRVSQVPPELSASRERPLFLVTSGLSGIYPAGVPIGVVTELRASSDGLFQEGQVAIDDRLLILREAAIFIPLLDLIEDTK